MKLNFSQLAAARITSRKPDLIPLCAIEAPRLASLQNQIRAQQKLIEQMTEAIGWILDEIRVDEGIREEVFLTLSHDKLVTAYANASGEPRAETAFHFRAHHDPRSAYGCLDDPPKESV
jgi:hypothetical protein